MAQKIVRANGQAVKPAAEEGKKVTQTVKKAAEEGKKVNQTVKPAPPASNGSTVGLRIGAVVCWVLAIACEILCILALTNYFYPPFNKTAFLIIGILLDLGLAIAAAQMWKKANRIKPMSGKNKVLFYLWSELGVIMACICFIPLIVLLIKDKNLDKKSKLIVTIIAVVALLITGVASADFDPITAEEKAEAEAVVTQDVFWSTFGHKYHTEQDCQAIANSATLYQGTVTEAIESGRTSLCAFCARRHPELESVKSEDAALEEAPVEEEAPDAEAQQP